jgi:hypothetical protein
LGGRQGKSNDRNWVRAVAIEAVFDHPLPMVEVFQRLMKVRDLLERALEESDTLDDTFLGAMIDTVLQDVNAKIDELRAK